MHFLRPNKQEARRCGVGGEGEGDRKDAEDKDGGGGGDAGKRKRNVVFKCTPEWCEAH